MANNEASVALKRQLVTIVKIINKQSRFYVDMTGNLKKSRDGALIHYDNVMDALREYERGR